MRIAPVAALVLLAVAPAASGQPIVLLDCIGLDHPPFDDRWVEFYPEGGSSYLLPGIVTDDPNAVADLSVYDPQGELIHERLDMESPDGTFWEPTPIFQYGLHEASWNVGGTLHQVSLEVGPEERACDPDTLAGTSGDAGGWPAWLTAVVVLVLLATLGFAAGFFSVRGARDPCVDLRRVRNRLKKERDAKQKELEEKGDELEAAASHEAEAAKGAADYAALRKQYDSNLAKGQATMAKDPKAGQALIDQAKADAVRLRDMAGAVETADQASKSRVKLVAELKYGKQRLDEVDAALEEAERALAKCEERAAALASSSDGQGPRDVQPDRDLCCPCGTWNGLTAFAGGGVLFWGYEKGSAYLTCSCNAKFAIVQWTARRLGFVVGVEASIGFIRVTKATHVTALPDRTAEVLGGLDFDISIIAGWSKLGKAVGVLGKEATSFISAAAKVLEARRLSKAAKASGVGTKAAKAADEVARQEVKEVVRGLLPQSMGDVGELAADMAAKAGSSKRQTDDREGFHMPLGIGIQGGVWKVKDVKTQMPVYDGCATCDPK